jgi:hypothetical protein
VAAARGGLQPVAHGLNVIGRMATKSSTSDRRSLPLFNVEFLQIPNTNEVSKERIVLLAFGENDGFG